MSARARWSSLGYECDLSVGEPSCKEGPFLVYEYEPGEPVLAFCNGHGLEVAGIAIMADREGVTSGAA